MKLRFIPLCVFPLLLMLIRSSECQSGKVKPTKQQHQAAGFWRADPRQTGSLPWLAIYLGDSLGKMIVRWPTSIACQDEPAEMRGSIMEIGGHFPARFQLDGPKDATFAQGQVTLHMRKTKESTNFVCE